MKKTLKPKRGESVSLAIISGELKDDYREVLQAFWNSSPVTHLWVLQTQAVLGLLGKGEGKTRSHRTCGRGVCRTQNSGIFFIFLDTPWKTMLALGLQK